MDHSERFYQLLNEMKKTHYLKSKDYGDEEDVLANFRTCEMAGIPAWKGCCVRIGDKFSRIMGFAKKEKLEVKDESIKDTLKEKLAEEKSINRSFQSRAQSYRLQNFDFDLQQQDEGLSPKSSPPLLANSITEFIIFDFAAILPHRK